MLRNMDAANGEDMDINRGEYLCDECDADKERAECENCGDYIEDDLDPAGEDNGGLCAFCIRFETEVPCGLYYRERLGDG